MSNKRHKENHIPTDIAIVIASVLVAVFLVKTKILVNILTATKELEILGSFIAGMFFTSIFTTAPAIVTLGEIARANSVLMVAVIGAMGSVIGDLIIFRFVRDRLSNHITELLGHRGTVKRIRAAFKLKFFRFFTFLLGGLIIASPLPDELGITILGFSKIRTSWFVPLSFTFNFLGILLIGVVAKSL